MKKLLLALIISSAITATSQSEKTTGNQQVVTMQQPILNVTGTAKITLPANQVTFSISVSESGPEAKDVMETTRKKMMNLVVLLKGKINVINLKTEYIRLYNRNYVSKQDGFYTSQSLNFTLTDLTQYDALLTELLEAGANEVNQVTFGNSESEQQQDILLEMALRDAKIKAKRMAEAYGQTVGKAISISDAPEVGNSPSFVSYKSFAEADASGPSIVGGNLELSTRIYVQFELK